MSYVIAPDEPVDAAVPRVGRELASAALADLRRAHGGDDPDAGIHEARKAFKKIRALLRLARPALGEDRYGRENRAWRECGALLADARQSAATREALERLAPHFEGSVDAGSLERLRCWLGTRHGAQLARALSGDGAVARAMAEVRRGRRRMAGWKVADDPAALFRGLGRSYRTGRDAMRAAYADGTPTAFHEWRKRAKDLWYHARLLESESAPLLAVYALQLDGLTDRLGEANDFADLLRVAEQCPELPGEGPPESFRSICVDRRTAIWGEVRPLAELIYAAEPGVLVASVEAERALTPVLRAPPPPAAAPVPPAPPP